METHFLLTGKPRIVEYFGILFGSAKRTIQISCPRIDFESKTLHKLIFEPCQRKVKIEILTDEDCVSSSSADLPLECTVRRVKHTGPSIGDEFVACTNTAMKLITKAENKEFSGFAKMLEQGIYRYNRSYVLIDSCTLIFGSFSIDDTDVSDIANSHEIISVSTKCDPIFVDFVRENWDTRGCSSLLAHTSTTTTTIASSKIVGGNRLYNPEEETNLICQWIDEAKEYCYLETSIFLSHATTKNRIAEHLVRRLLRAHRTTVSANDGNSNLSVDPFCCVILTNMEHTNGTRFESPSYIADKVNYSLQYIIEELKNAGVVPTDLKNRIFLGHLMPLHTNFDNLSIIKGTFFIQDGKKCLLSSSSISDRSLTGIADRELAITIFDSKRIKSLEQEVWSNHLCHPLHKPDGTPDPLTFISFFEGCVEQQGRVKKPQLWAGGQKIFQHYKVYDFLLSRILGKIYYT